MHPSFSILTTFAAVVCLGLASSHAATPKNARSGNPKLSVQHSATKANWPSPAMLIPELPEKPQIDGAIDAVWQEAAAGVIGYPLGSKEAGKPDTRFHIGHRDGLLYLLLEYEWPEDKPLPARSGTDGSLWNDDGGEIFFSRLDRLGIARQILFNLTDAILNQDVYVDSANYHVVNEVTGLVPTEMSMKVGRTRATRTAEMAISLASVLGIKGEIGEAFRFNIISNRPDGGIIHWSPTEGYANARPTSFGFGILTGPASHKFDLSQLSSGNPSGLMLPTRPTSGAALTGYPLALTVNNPLTGALADPGNYHLSVEDSAGHRLLEQQIKLQSWPQTFSLQPGTLPAGQYMLQIQSVANKALAFTTPVSWQPSIAVEAEDNSQCKVQDVGDENKSYSSGYPRGAGSEALFLAPKSKVTVSNYGTAVYMIMAPGFFAPGPYYGSSADAILRCKVDDGAWRHIPPIANANAIPLAENLPLGLHKVTVECQQGGWVPIDKFIFALKPLAGIKGILTAPDYNELMTDARADIYQGTKLVRSEYVRNPINGRFIILGLEPGSYRIRFSAAAWKSQEVKDITIRHEGERVDIGVVSLPFDERRAGYTGFNHRSGKTLSIQPGATFTITSFHKEFKGIELVSPYKTIPLKVNGLVKVTDSGVATDNGISVTVPDSTPYDMYDLRFVFADSVKRWNTAAAQVVCVREALPDSFAVALMGHMNTWGQQTSEYLAKVNQMVQLAGARTSLISNEVNAAYVAGALKDLSIPYLATSGNHTMARWDDFFGPQSLAYDDGPMRIVTFGSDPSNLWLEPAHLLAERPEATNRVLLAYEAIAPLDVIIDNKVNLLADAHGVGNHPDRAKFPPGTLQITATDFQTVRWIPMTRTGLDPSIKKTEDAPSLIVPRLGPAPLRVEYKNGNEGIKTGETARIINGYAQRFPHARVRLILKAGNYGVTGGKVVQSFTSDNLKTQIIDVEADVAPNSVTIVTAILQ